MFALFYLPVTSPLVCASEDSTLLVAWVDEPAQTLIECAEQAGHDAADPLLAALRLQTCADMCLLDGRVDEADRLYRQSMRRLVEPCDIDSFSCRAAGYMSLFHHRLEPAAGCFQRLSSHGANVAIRLEAMLVLSLLFHHASLFAEAHADLNRLADLATASGMTPWLELAHVVGRHFAVLARVHASTELDGHVGWRVATESAVAIQRLARLPARAHDVAGGADIAALLARRSDHVLRLDLLSDPARRSDDAAIDPSSVGSWCHGEPELTRPQAFVETAMAALSTRRVRLAGILLAPVLAEHPLPRLLPSTRTPSARSPRRGRRDSPFARHTGHGHFELPPAAPWPPVPFARFADARPRPPVRDMNALWNDAPVVDHAAELRAIVMRPLEQDYVYAVSRLRAQQGHEEEAARHYRSYLVRALAGIGKLGAALRRSLVTQTPRPELARRASAPSSGTPSDDVTRRLPPRYLGAYRYMMDHLSRVDLSTREMATHAQLTERSLQMAFRRYLGETPRELLRRRRIERIHAELLRRPHAHADVMEVAMRHGVTSRATLVAGFRKHYSQTPADSLAEVARTFEQAGPVSNTAFDAGSGPVISRADVAGAP